MGIHIVIFSYFSKKKSAVVTHWNHLAKTMRMSSHNICFGGELRKIVILIYCNNPKYWDRRAFANSVDPDQMPQNAASDQGLHCLPYMQRYSRHTKK